MIKVLMAGNIPSNFLSVKGGVETAILNLLSGFSQLQEISIAFICFTDDLETIRETDYAPNIKIYFVPTKVKFQLLDYFSNRKVLKDIIKRENPQIIHIQSSSALLLRFWGFPKNKIVVTQHGIKSEEIKYVKGLKKRLKLWVKVIVQKYYFPFFKNLVFISNYNKKLFTGKNYFSEIIYNSVNPIFFEKHRYSENINSLIFVAGLQPRKNLDLVLESLNCLKKKNIIYTLNVVGGFISKDYEEEIYRKIDDYNLSKHVIFYGWLSQKELLEVYSKCSIFVLPSLQETLPVSIAEAMALGKVVIASDVGAISEMFKNEVSGYLIKNNDLDDLNHVLQILSQNRELINHISHSAKNEALAKYYPRSVASKTKKFYNKIIDLNHL